MPNAMDEMFFNPLHATKLAVARGWGGLNYFSGNEVSKHELSGGSTFWSMPRLRRSNTSLVDNSKSWAAAKPNSGKGKPLIEYGI